MEIAIASSELASFLLVVYKHDRLTTLLPYKILNLIENFCSNSRVEHYLDWILTETGMQ